MVHFDFGSSGVGEATIAEIPFRYFMVTISTIIINMLSLFVRSLEKLLNPNRATINVRDRWFGDKRDWSHDCFDVFKGINLWFPSAASIDV